MTRPACSILVPRLLDEQDWSRVAAFSAAKERTAAETTEAVVHISDRPDNGRADGFNLEEFRQLKNHLRWPPLSQLYCFSDAGRGLASHYELADTALALCQMFNGVVHLDSELGHASSKVRGRRWTISYLASTDQIAEYWIVDGPWLATWRAHPEFRMTS